ncbi:MAG: hypothetical protein C0594_10545 [Marinilabiliales bacterium]|nr:MAG: hypothetical protein C0594_10545 [Marinilabiliales bacterium]
MRKLKRHIGLNNNFLVFILLLFMFSSCEDYLDVDCSQCYQYEPTKGDLLIDVTINKENMEVPVIIYKGKPEDGVIEYADTARGKYFDIEVPLGQYYSVCAKYKVGDKTVTAIDGDKIRVRQIDAECDTTCYYITGGRIDVQLKYTTISD